MYDFITIDFETANNNLNSACSVGIVGVKGKQVILSDYHLISPPTNEFSAKNVSIHGITAEMVKGADSFCGVWELIKPYFDNSKYIIAHNAQFDMSVLYCCFEECGATAPPFFYIDSIHIGHTCCPVAIQGNGLEVIADAYGVDIGMHHNALDDAMAVAKIIIEAIKINQVDDFHQLHEKCNIATKAFSDLKPNHTFGRKIAYADDTIMMQDLKSIAEEFIADGIIETEEINILASWLIDHPQLTGYYPFDKISTLCTDILEDGIITDEEKSQMLSLLQQFVNPVECCSCSCKISFPEKVFVLSGDFTSGSKKEVETKIAEKGGICKGNVTKKTDYLIVGGAGNDNWKFGNYGGKVSKALEMQEKGHHIVILKESDLMNCL